MGVRFKIREQPKVEAEEVVELWLEYSTNGKVYLCCKMSGGQSDSILAITQNGIERPYMWRSTQQYLASDTMGRLKDITPS